ncbi:hypothetical protein [Campylobacter rectus]|uniref:hypothetical protein n=1 Tax=Campylobacter rectus TaxID=203 RepID=UPI0028EE13AE|nr:hypothetical protein [Campylobacter rectus]
MAYFLFKTHNVDDYASNLDFDNSISWDQGHSELKAEDVVFIYLIDEKRFICAAIVDSAYSNNKDDNGCYLTKLWDIKESDSDAILKRKSDFKSLRAESNKIKISDNNLIDVLLKTYKNNDVNLKRVLNV